ncbi:MAG: T9SS type A sorting domain-containing protein [candidate division KSB1 bacterium]|nr:T9SS type A sorting domain-containing protein [candidate division KSB1 bacterium]MDZ7303954.1 T9SS type A sorting domain-containing protein [candidate division KSB1 bacterium]MDZ7313700.1 T9SS type A sorting domain-containing protein [candidate division KSB1 bacterium]
MKLAKFFFALGVGLVVSFGSQWALAQTNFWEPSSGPLASSDIRAFAINSNGHVFAGTNGGGVFRSMNNGDNWTPFNAGLANLEIISLAINSSGHIFAGTNYGGVFRSPDSSDNWTVRNNGLTDKRVRALAINQSTGHIFAGTPGGIFRSPDNGDNWTKINTGLTNKDVRSLVINPTTQDIFAGTSGGGVFHSTNNGDIWTAVNTGLPNSALVFALAINSSGHVFAATGDGVYRSLDNGGNWAKVLDFDGQTFYSLAINSTTQDIFAGSGHIGGFPFFSDWGDVFRSTNNGESWTHVASGLADYVYALAINIEGYIFAGTPEGGYRSTDNGQRWTLITFSTSVQAHERIPLEFGLHQNYPNPFNPSTTITYELPQAVEVKLVIFDLMGRHVRTLVNQRQPAGRYTITWDGRNEQGEALASGVYLYQLRAGNFVQTRRMALVR